MDTTLNELLSHPWWIYDPDATGRWGLAYRWFNLFEGSVWLGFAVLVIGRWVKWPRSVIEVGYAVAFAAFGMTDIWEAYEQSAALVLVKGVNLAALLALRRRVMRRWYPVSRLF